jgi:hypothetical protein
MALKNIASLHFIHLFSYLNYFRLVVKWKMLVVAFHVVFASTFSIPINIRLTL